MSSKRKRNREQSQARPAAEDSGVCVKKLKESLSKSLKGAEEVIVVGSDEEVRVETDDSDEDAAPARTVRRRPTGRATKKYSPVEKCKVTKNVKTDDVNRINITLTTTQMEKDLQFTKDLVKSRVDTGKMTYKLMRRANFIIEMARQEKVIVDMTKLMKLIKEFEKNDGHATSIDKKSLMRLVVKLSKDGYIKYKKATLTSDQKEKTVCFICDAGIDDDHSIISSALDQAKMKFFINTKEKMQEENDPPAKNQEPVAVPEPTYAYNRNASRTYGLGPKMQRTRLIHELLFYLIYDFPKDAALEDSQVDRFFKEKNLVDVFENELPMGVYNREVGWKMFIPPLPSHNGYPTGWVLISDVLLRLPLFIFLKCFNIPYVIPGLEDYQKHPIKKYFLVKSLPPEVRNGLMHGRKYIFNMHEILLRLCYMGLIQFGPQKLKEKDQIFVYLNRKATLLDTSPSSAGYHQVSSQSYQKKSYSISSTPALERYWYELWSICMNTNLGTRNHLLGQYIVVEQPHSKPSLLESTKPKTPEVLVDAGDVPGDHSGAAGLDSSLFVHLKRNWNSPDLVAPQRPPQPPPEPPKPQKTKPQRKKVIRQILPKKSKKKRPRYDEKDKLCFTRMSRCRIDWSQVEDNVLMLCTVADRYLCPNRRRQWVEYTVMRDILHKILPQSRDKTSRACQHRINYMMRNHRTKRSVQMCLEEVKQCELVGEKFGALLRKHQGVSIPTGTLNIAFVELVQYMNRKFLDMIPKGGSQSLPDSIQEVFSRFERVAPRKGGKWRDVEVRNDVLMDVVRSVVHSSMACAKDKTSWSWQLFQVYQQYPEQLLRGVIAKMRHDQMISVKKSFIKSPHGAGCVPLSSTPFQLSIHYAHQLQNNRFHYETLLEANAFIRQVSSWVEGEFEVASVDSGAIMLIPTLLETMQVDFHFEHPEEVIILDPSIEKEKYYEEILKRYMELVKDPTVVPTWEEDGEIDFDAGTTSFSRHRSSTRIAFHMMRAQMSEGVDKNSAQHIHDYFVVNASRVFLRSDRPRPEFAQLQAALGVPQALEQFRARSVVRDASETISSVKVSQYFPEQAIGNADLEYIEKIRCAVWSSGELGATMPQLRSITPDSPSRLTINQVLRLLTDSRIVLRLGTSQARFVHFDHKSSWLVKSDRLLRLDREKLPKALPPRYKGKHLVSKVSASDPNKLRLLLSPWIRLDGSLNRRVLDRWLGSVLSTILDEPGMSLQELATRYDFIKPVEVACLIELLIGIGCVNILKVRKPRVSLFSAEPDYGFVPADVLDEPRDVLIDPEEEAVFNFALFLGQRNYNVNFFN